MTSIICDSSALISLAETCNISSLYFLREFNASFLITPAVKDEIIRRPMLTKQYEFSALRLKKLIDDRVVQIITSPTLVQETRNILSICNSVYSVNGRTLKIIQEGEAQCLAIFESAKANALLIDEKTTRMLIEDPLRMRNIIQSEYTKPVLINENRLAEFKKRTKDIKVIRSAEIIAISAIKGFFRDFRDSEHEAFKASLYALRNAGCNLSQEEIHEYERMEW